MLLLEETLAHGDGVGPAFSVGRGQQGRLLVLTLGIMRIGERDKVLISIWGCANGADWGLTPLMSYTPKHHCGLYSAVLNLAACPDVQYLRVHWHVRHWKTRSNDDGAPVCSFYVAADVSGSRLGTAA